MTIVFSLLSTLLFVVSSLISISTYAAPFTFEDEFLKADEAFISKVEQQGKQIRVNFQIAPGYYLYRQQFKFQGKQLNIDKAQLPEGITHQDQYFGVQQIFREHLTFQLTLKEIKNNAELIIRYQGCADKGLCYPPTTKSITISQTQ